MGGTIEQIITEQTNNIKFIQDYFTGKLERNMFRNMVMQNKDVLINVGLNEYWINLLKQMPSDNKQDPQRMLDELYSAKSIESSLFDEAGFQLFKKDVDEKFMHLPSRYTSIFSEETRCAYALSKAIMPTNVVVAGSYYNYFVVWLFPGLTEGGKITCLDVDPSVCALAEKNMKALGLERHTNIICSDAEKYLINSSESIDLLVLDAYGSNTHTDKRYHGKAIYAPLLKAALKSLNENSFVLAHNAEEGAKDRREFYQIVSDFKFSMLVNTTENIGVFQK